MKILFLSQGHKISDHPGYQDALIKLKNEGFISDFLNIPYFDYAKDKGWDAFYSEVIRLCGKENSNVVFFNSFTVEKFQIQPNVLRI